jgi:hypothetical protein
MTRIESQSVRLYPFVQALGVSLMGAIEPVPGLGDHDRGSAAPGLAHRLRRRSALRDAPLGEVVQHLGEHAVRRDETDTGE